MHDNYKIATQMHAKSTKRTCQNDSACRNTHLYATPQTKAALDINIPHDSINTITATLSDLSEMTHYRYGGADALASTLSLLPLGRRRWFQRQTCLLCILAAFICGLFLGIFVPMVDLSNVFSKLSTEPAPPAAIVGQHVTLGLTASGWEALPYDKVKLATPFNRTTAATHRTNLKEVPHSPFNVAFISEHEGRIGAEEILSDGAHHADDRRDARVQRTADAPLARPTAERTSKMLHDFSAPTWSEQQTLENNNIMPKNILQRPSAQKKHQSATPTAPGIIKSNIYWGELVERALPQGFSAQDTRDWNAYVTSETAVQRLELGCGRMQNRLLTFRDGTRACARYRQNTDQIQGELFSFYLGRLLNMTNLAPSAVLTVNVESDKWTNVVHDIMQAQWKQQRPVVLTRWLPNLEPAGIPQPFQPIDRHLNKQDVWNITLAFTTTTADKGSSVSVEAAENASINISITPNSLALERLVELAQWSDLIVFDYLIANLDRVVNNLYNFQWNAEIMAAPAHNLARQSNSQLLIFLDNESGLLHGYRLLKKYEAYHGLLLNNLCVFREPTIRALRQLRDAGAGRKLREVFEQTASAEVRDVLPTLPDKSIKILNDRIDRVLGQVDKCKQMISNS
ncbi:PREDICTED: extracellular serine/threonine protein kinase four-jointed [Bactrocera latifrons]|uniref:extracellular serine/threonine protein kinase four-jointed n=1 Tax=Bactrocera latifrons TaxID=174628 RepID=UPI0008DE76A3|nr:PREDICTED: extracellular serine/threonine protein kinase four-jointed [Bactrocera latifrons]